MRQSRPEPPTLDVGCFLYCTLVDPDELARLGVRHPSLQPARLPGWRLTFTPDPDIVPAAGKQVEGFFVNLPPDTARDLLARKNETGFKAHPVQVHTANEAPAAIAFVSDRPPIAPKPEQVEAYLETCWRLGLPKEHCDAVAAEAQRLRARANLRQERPASG